MGKAAPLGRVWIDVRVSSAVTLFGLAGVACASARSATVVAPSPLACTLVGIAEPPMGTSIHAESDHDSEIARAAGRAVRIEATLDPSRRRVHVSVFAPPAGPALRIDGWMDPSELLLRARRDLAVVPDHVWITAGTPVEPSPGADLGVEARFFDGFDGLRATADCSALAFPGDAPPGGRRASSGGAPVHSKIPLLELRDAPGGRVVASLHAHAPEVITMLADREAQGFRHITLDDGLRIEGWIRASDLEDGEGADCDDCRGGVSDVDDICLPEGASGADEGCPVDQLETLHASRELVVRTLPSLDAPRIGALERGADAFVIARRGAWASLRPKSAAVRPGAQGEFWVSLDP